MKRPKKPSIKTIREKKFSEMIEGLKHRPHNGIVQRVDSKIFSLDGNRLYHYKPDVLSFEEYKRCLELFERRLPNEFGLPTPGAVVELQLLMLKIDKAMQHKELKHKEELERIAVDTIRSLFDIPEHVKILPEISRNLNLDPEDQDDSPEPVLSLSPEEQRRMYQEIQKRIILNGLVHGAAMHIWKSAHYIIKEEIDKLDPMLMDFYDIYTTSIGWLIWELSPDEAQEAIEGGKAMTQGFNQLKFDEEGEPDCNVLCHAVNFPVLLHEITKGAMDYLICRSIPQDYSEEMLEYYYSIADDYSNELYHYLMSPTLWIRLVEAVDLETQHLPKVIMKLTQLSYDELCDIFMSIIDNVNQGREKLLMYKII